MATFKEFNASDVRTSRSFLNQIVDFVEEDISGSSTRQTHKVFVTGGQDQKRNLCPKDVSDSFL